MISHFGFRVWGLGFRGLGIPKPPKLGKQNLLNNRILGKKNYPVVATILNKKKLIVWY